MTPVSCDPYGHLPDGRTVHCYTLRNRHGITARVMDYGAILIGLEAPDAAGHCADLTHGFDDLEGWLQRNVHYFGATIGRYGNRIADGRFTLDGTAYVLATNNTPAGIPCALHGGLRGFDKALWQSRILDGHRVEMRLVSPAGEEGYPGTLEVKLIWSLTDDNELIWQATAITDAPTVLNLVHHSYWNLSGDGRRNILDHQLTLHADHYLPTTPGAIPTGELAAVAGTPMDFTTPHPIGERIEADFEALRLGAGYDHCWVLGSGGQLRSAALLEHSASGRRMEILTDQPGVQCYTANWLDGSIAGKGGVLYPRRSAICLETQKFPDSPNQPHFPSCVLRPGETYKHTLVHRFSHS